MPSPQRREAIMHRTLASFFVATALSVPADAQEAPKVDVDMTCADFLALDESGQLAAMLELRAGGDGAEISAEEEAEDATAVTNATVAGAIGGADGAQPTEPDMAPTPEAKQRASGMRTSCTGMENMPAIDAMIAAHADYEPVLDPETSGN